MKKTLQKMIMEVVNSLRIRKYIYTIENKIEAWSEAKDKTIRWIKIAGFFVIATWILFIASMIKYLFY